MTGTGAPANWYPDPAGGGGLRYWDGASWTGHRAPPPPPPQWAQPPVWGPPPWKGAQLGRPFDGPGALANPGRRLAARVLDGLVLVPVFALFLGVTLAIAAPSFGPIFPDLPVTGSTQSVPTPGFVWIYLTIFCCAAATGIVALAYETVATAKYGRTLGKAWLRIRPLRVDGGRLSWGRALGRVSFYTLISGLGWIGFIDSLWCLWDDTRQCLHDKVADTIVVNDGTPGTDGH